jgi:transposase
LVKEVVMPRKQYPVEFREQIVELAQNGRSVASLAREFGPTESTIATWVKQAEIDSGRRPDGVTSSEKEELTRLRRENRQLQQERDILAKAAAWFARETGSLPRTSS